MAEEGRGPITLKQKGISELHGGHGLVLLATVPCVCPDRAGDRAGLTAGPAVRPRSSPSVLPGATPGWVRLRLCYDRRHAPLVKGGALCAACQTV